MNNTDFKAMNWMERIDYFKEVGVWQTFLISKDQDHPLYMDANDYFNEKNE